MTGKYLVDTNILIYAYDRSEPVKQAKALEVLDTLAGNGGYLSPQILAEFFSVATKKIAAPLSIEQGYASLGNYIQFWDIVDLTSAIVLEAARGVKDHQLSFWDSLIWATARLNQIPTVMSEDFSHNSTIEGVRFLNPFEGI